MKLSDVIKKLEEMKGCYGGDVEVFMHGEYCSRRPLLIKTEAITVEAELARIN
jgi:hypothetical protein